ncbi:MAG: hypothetical protein AAGD32_09250 [Planctomycetota bacterium]
MNQSDIKFAAPSPEKKARQRRNAIAGAAVAVLVVGAAAWAFWPTPDVPTVAKDRDEFRELPKEERRAAIEELGETVPERMEKIREIEDPQARRAAVRNMFREEMQKRQDAYFAAPPEERESVLDAQLDEFLEMREERQRRREEAQANGEARPERGPGERGERDRAREGGRRGGGANNPAARAQRAEYMAAMRQRAQERGIEMPGRGGFGGRRGGPGGGR